ncbi:uncharacterized protein LOC123894182 [Trifolium pratense]|uniref:uncharacterized protein LOC123894182 n=1 Tax=Trifolium pratense TaxID=57577 RepID=UPI001E6979FA|nr:uncharacterized protein LOC123894182 [Trifolium pratense]
MTHTLEYSANVSPPKAKHLLSRICKDCLPTRTRLRNHFVQCQEECPLCSQVPEEEWHLLVECEGSREAWSVMGLEQILTPRLQSCNNIQELIFDICCRESKEVAGKMALLMWVLWQNRNNFVWHETRISARQAGLQAMSMWEDWIQVNGQVVTTNKAGQQQHVAHVNEQQQPPRYSYLKCNVDASFLGTTNATGSGWCFRDNQGRFLLAGSNVILGRLNTIEGEAVAMKEAISEAIQRGFTHVIFESDSQILIDAISSRQQGYSTFSPLISNIRSLLSLVPNFELFD